MKYSIRRTSQFKKDFKLCLKRGLDIDEFTKVLTLLQEGAPHQSKAPAALALTAGTQSLRLFRGASRVYSGLLSTSPSCMA